MGWPFDKLMASWPFTRRSKPLTVTVKGKRTGAAAHTVVVRAKFDSAQTNADFLWLMRSLREVALRPGTLRPSCRPMGR